MLYKYIDPHLVAIATVQDETASLVIHLIDTVTGSLVWTAQHAGEADSSAPVALSLTENWLVYSFSEKKSEGRHTQVVSVELFENATREEKASYVSFQQRPVT